tara:strand:- start:6005 stop:6673 length:669 start_codon:yes stop_codon:yes gene_type:complete
MYISLGNNCTVTLSLNNLGLKKESMPFDYIVSNPRIIYDCFKTNFTHFTNINTKHSEYRDNNLVYFYPKIKSSFPGFPMHSLENEYGIKFHHFGGSPVQLSEMFKRRTERFLNILEKSNEEIIFFYCTETYIYDNISRNNSELDYQYLQKIDNYLSNNYKNLKFKIVNFTINKNIENSNHLENIYINVPEEHFSDNCETHKVEVFQPFRKNIQEKIKNYINI